MADRSRDDMPAPRGQESFRRAFARVALRYFLGRGGWWPRLMLLGLVLLTVAQVALAVRMNMWNADLFDALDNRNTDHFLKQCLVFVLLVAGLMLANAAHLQLKRDLQLHWRGWLTRRLTERWLSEGRHHALSLLASEHASNPDGRIAEDIRVTTEAAVDLATTLFSAGLILVSFLSILWTLSGVLAVPLPFAVDPLEVPGHMVVLALVYSAAGGTVALLLGRPLVRATDARQGREADFRYGLTRARENAEALALAQAEPQERQRLTTLFGLLGQVWAQQTRTLRGLLLFSVGYQQFAPVLPLLVSTPRYLAGAVTLGGLVQMAQAFQQVTTALSWPVDNAQKLAEWRASAERVLALRAAIATLDAERRATLYGEPLAEGGLLLDGLVLHRPDGSAITRPLYARFVPGETVRLAGDAEAGALLCQAIAGIWRWGEGSIRLAEGVTPALRIATPWLVEAPLAEILSRPSGAEPAIMQAALTAAGLAPLVPSLQAAKPWGEVLSLPEQQRLMFARLLVRRPKVVLMDRALQALPAPDQAALLSTLRTELPEAVMLLVDAPPEGAPRIDQVLDLDTAQQTQPARAVEVPRRGSVVDWLNAAFGYRR